jgi:hypothetical protein
MSLARRSRLERGGEQTLIVFIERHRMNVMCPGIFQWLTTPVARAMTPMAPRDGRAWTLSAHARRDRDRAGFAGEPREGFNVQA